MRNVKQLFGIGVALAVVGLSGCAYNFGFGQAGFRVAGSCAPMQRQQAFRTSSFHSARQQIAAAQARFSYAGGAGFYRPEGMKAVASGECRY